MSPQQQHYSGIAKKNGWFDENGKTRWPADEVQRRAMARRMLGMELVVQLDGEIERSEDTIHDTKKAQWAKQSSISENDLRLRSVFRSMTQEQREACVELLRKLGRSFLFSFCVRLDQFAGGALEMGVFGTDPQNPDEMLRIQPGDFLDMHDEQEIWLEEFSRIFGKNSSESGSRDQ